MRIKNFADNLSGIIEADAIMAWIKGKLRTNLVLRVILAKLGQIFNPKTYGVDFVNTKH